MKKKHFLYVSAALFLLFIIYTILVATIDKAPIGPNDSIVGFSNLNGWFHHLTGVHMNLYTITDWGSIPAILLAMLFALIGLIQLIKRKSLFKVDKDILVLGGFYIVVFLVYLFFEFVVINRRPVLIEGILEASYPSSTTFLSLTFMMSSIHFVNKYFKNNNVNLLIKCIAYAYMLFLIVGRLISGVHWLSDIVGSLIISFALLSFYRYMLLQFDEEKEN